MPVEFRYEPSPHDETSYRGATLRKMDGFFSIPYSAFSRIGDHPEGTPLRLGIQLRAHPNLSRRIIVSMPGLGATVDGYKDKYLILAHHMQKEGLGAVLRLDHRGIPGITMSDSLEQTVSEAKFRASMECIEQSAWNICGEPKPDLFLMGFSAGAATMAALAHEYPAIKRILLFSPSGNMPEERVQEGLDKFKGEVYIVVGAQDKVAGEKYKSMATGASRKKLFVFPECDHRFAGEANGRMLSQMPFYAFGTEKTPNFFPDPQGGIKLYD